jgi:hypothetical protein
MGVNFLLPPPRSLENHFSASTIHQFLQLSSTLRLSRKLQYLAITVSSSDPYNWGAHLFVTNGMWRMNCWSMWYRWNSHLQPHVPRFGQRKLPSVGRCAHPHIGYTLSVYPHRSWIAELQTSLRNPNRHIRKSPCYQFLKKSTRRRTPNPVPPEGI